jgi:hypothetical protein
VIKAAELINKRRATELTAAALSAAAATFCVGEDYNLNMAASFV